MPITCLVFDCDGIIIESVHIKAKAFEILAEPYGREAQDRLLMYNKIHGGINRLVKFRWFFDEVLKQPISQEQLIALNKDFTALYIEEIKKCPLVPGVEQTLITWHKRLPMYVCSGAPQGELEYLLKLRKLEHYFVSIHGSPPAKEELLRRIAIHSKCANHDILMIGDSSTDMLAAEAIGTQFYGRGQDFQGGTWPWEVDLCGLNGWIQNNIV